MRLSHFLISLLVVAIWGLNFVVLKIGLQGVPPMVLAAIRFFLASIPLVFFIKRPAIPFKKVLLYGLTMFVLQFSLLFYGMKAGMPAGLTSLVLQSQIFFTLIFAVLFLKEKLVFFQIIGIILSFLGMAVIGSKLNGSVTLLGFLLVIAAAIAWSAGNIVSKKIGKTNVFSVIVWGSLVAWPPLLISAVFTEGMSSFLSVFYSISFKSLFAIFYTVYISTLLGFTLWAWILSRYSASKVAPLTIFVPLFGMLGGFFILDEPIESWKIFPALLIVLGFLVMEGSNRYATKLVIKKNFIK